MNIDDGKPPKIELLGFLYYSAIALVSTIAREKTFHKDYGSSIKLRRESHNATSFYAPLLDNFNCFRINQIVSLLQFSLVLIYIKARNGNFFYCIKLTTRGWQKPVHTLIYTF